MAASCTSGGSRGVASARTAPLGFARPTAGTGATAGPRAWPESPPVNWIIADQSLTGYMGHCFEYARAIRGRLLELGHPATVLANVQASRQVIEALDAVPCFRHGLDHDFAGRLYPILPRSLRQIVPREWNYLRHCRGLYRDLVGAESKLTLGRDTIVLFHTIRHNHVLPIVKWAERLRGRERYFASGEIPTGADPTWRSLTDHPSVPTYDR